jgi:hypothetical protein
VWKTAEVSTSGAVNLNPPPSYSFVSYCSPFPCHYSYVEPVVCLQGASQTEASFMRNVKIFISNGVNKQEMLLCGDGFVDFIHRPKSKILKIQKLKLRRFGSWHCFRHQVNGRGEEKNTYSVRPLRQG